LVSLIYRIKTIFQTKIFKENFIENLASYKAKVKEGIKAVMVDIWSTLRGRIPCWRRSIFHFHFRNGV